MRYKRKTKQNRKNYGVYVHAEKNEWEVHREEKYEKINLGEGGAQLD